MKKRTLDNPIGIFDSGVGGLTVFKEIRRCFPFEDIIYFGDTARVPYGSKSKNTIVSYSIQNARFLIENRVKVIVVACNTSSALALEELKAITNIPILGVIDAGAEMAVNTTKLGKIGVIGTEGTINSRAYHAAIKKLDKDVHIVEKACPLFVPLVEEGWHDNQITKQIIKVYLEDILLAGIDTLVLGCTHYPILKKSIQEVCGHNIHLIDSAEVVSKRLISMLHQKSSTNNELINDVGSHQTFMDKESRPGLNYFYVSDNQKKFANIATNIMDIENFYIQEVSVEFNNRK